MTATWRWRRLDDTIVAYASVGTSTPSDDGGWRELVQSCLDLVRDAERHPHARMLVIADGAQPRARALVEAWHAAVAVGDLGRRLPVAVAGVDRLPSSLVQRFHTWLNLRAFDEGAFAGALAWLQIDAYRAPAVLSLLDEVAPSESGSARIAALDAALVAIVARASPDRRVAEERAEVAKELAEILGPELASVRTGLAAFALRADRATRTELGRLSERVEETRDELEGIVWAMGERARTWREVTEYLDERVRELSQGGPRCDVTCRGEGATTIEGATALHVLRIVQEGVRNAVRHAGATTVGLALACDDDAIEVVIVDDGGGIAPDRLDAEHGGLRNIRARARSLGGSARLESGAHGTRWTITVPMAHGDQT